MAAGGAGSLPIYSEKEEKVEERKKELRSQSFDLERGRGGGRDGGSKEDSTERKEEEEDGEETRTLPRVRARAPCRPHISLSFILAICMRVTVVVGRTPLSFCPSLHVCGISFPLQSRRCQRSSSSPHCPSSSSTSITVTGAGAATRRRRRRRRRPRPPPRPPYLIVLSPLLFFFFSFFSPWYACTIQTPAKKGSDVDRGCEEKGGDNTRVEMGGGRERRELRPPRLVLECPSFSSSSSPISIRRRRQRRRPTYPPQHRPTPTIGTGRVNLDTSSLPLSFLLLSFSPLSSPSG